MSTTTPTRPAVSVRAFNTGRPIIKPSLDAEEFAALAEVEDHYAPSALVRLVTTSFRSGPGAGFHVGHGQYFDFDHVVGRLLGVRGMATSYASQVYGGGKGLDLHDAYVSSIGEGMERVLGSFAFLQLSDRMRFGTYDELTAQGLACLGPEDVPLFSDEQYADPHFPFDRWEKDAPLGWIAGTRWFSGEEVYVPAQLVLFIYYPSPEEPLIGLAPSGGLASHINARRSWLHAIDELFERDAVNLRWHGRVPLDRIEIDVEPRDPAVSRALDELSDCVGAPQFFLQSLDVPEFPVVTAIQFDRWLTELSYNAGGGVGPTVEAAMRSALGEYCQSERSLRIRQVAHDWQFSIAFDRLFGIHADAEPHEFSRFVQAIAYYGYAERVDQAAWYFEDGGTVRLSELHAQLDELDPDPYRRMEQTLRSRDIDPIMFDFTLGDLRHTKLTKAFIPELTPPYPQQSPALGHPRYRDVPVATGHRESPLTTGELLADPIPYP